ncbi:hypothetical protein LB505_012810 [Fusarium chuoi]|nr:hypothetical protein LB505_012810 [Fusarium chuoi]
MPFIVPYYILDDPFFPFGPLFYVSTSISYNFFRKRAEASNCVLEVLADGVVVAVEPINSSSQGTFEFSSNPFRTGRTVEFTYRETCGSSSRTVGAIVNKIVAKLAPEGAISTPIPSIPIRTESTTGTNSEIATTDSDERTAVTTGTNSEGATTNSEGETSIPTETATNSEGATTNSEDETIIPTETSPGTNSEGATTNSEGETVIRTETATNTNSEGATTNSEGETIVPTGTATGTATSTVSSAFSTATSPAGFPGEIGLFSLFSLFGCVGSTAGFPTFTLAQSSESMHLEICADLCTGRAYFGVYDT